MKPATQVNHTPNRHYSPAAGMTDVIPAAQHRTPVFIIGHHDFSTDGLASMLEARDSRYKVTLSEPGESCMADFAASGARILLIQNEALESSVERFVQHTLRDYPDLRILVFGKNMSDDRLYDLVRAGAHGYINERMSGDHIKSALDSLNRGNTWIERHIMERFISAQHTVDELLVSQFHSKIDQLCTQLTRRETEILCQVVKGLAIKQIAEEVHLSHQGVKMHLAKLFRKFKVANRNQLILAAFDEISPVDNLSSLLQHGLNKRLAQMAS